MNDAPRPATIAILAFPETSASAVYGMYDLFVAAGRDWGVMMNGVPGTSLFDARIVARQRQPFLISNDVQLIPHALLDEGPAPDIVCIPEVNMPPGHPLDGLFSAEIAWLRQRYREGSTIATACSAAMLLAHAGLLDGCEATTHWAWCDTLRSRFPKVTVREQRALVVSGEGSRLIMAGGGVSWMDLALYLIARQGGPEAAMQVARINLIDWHDVGQQPFAMLARTRQSDDALIGRCQTWIAENYRDTAPVAAMVKLSGLAERSFNRRFHQATGMSPLEYVHTLRMEEAKQMLEAGDESIEAIANEVGYEDAGFFSRLFKRRVNLSPAQYRKRFGAMRRAFAGGTADR
jgi:transcriptional regulator GlxA family with amidase domain